MWNNKKQQKSCFLYVKLTNLLSFSTRFPKSVPTYRRQVVNPRHRTPQGQSVAKPGNQLYATFLLIHCLFVLQITESHQTDGVVPLGRLLRLRGHIADFYDRRYLLRNYRTEKWHQGKFSHGEQKYSDTSGVFILVSDVSNHANLAINAPLSMVFWLEVSKPEDGRCRQFLYFAKLSSHFISSKAKQQRF